MSIRTAVSRLPHASHRAVLAAVICAACGGGGTEGARPTVHLAVAGNFAAPIRDLARDFHEATGTTVEVSLGSTSQLFAQISNGAPYDVFLAADTARPRALEDAALAVANTRFTYAVGRLAMYAPRWDTLPRSPSDLLQRPITRLAIADPRTAPYGVAAQTVLNRLDLWRDLEPRVARGANVGQAFQFVASGAADVGLIALAQVIQHDPRHYQTVSDTLHDAIDQDAVLLSRARENPAARAFLAFLQSDEGRRIISNFGYSRP